MNLTEYKEKSQLPDSDLIDGLTLHEDYLAVIYKKHKDYCIKFMQKQCNGNDYDELINDIYHDAILVLYEKAKNGDFVLTSSIQTYLNSICRYQLLNKFKDTGKFIILPDATNFDNEDEPYKYRPGINDWLPVDENDINSERVQAIVSSLELMRGKGDCYELLSMYYYHNKTMKQIAEHFDYKGEHIAKNKNYLCKEKLKTLTFGKLKKIR
ncbi:MAG: hypothetical protein K9G49_09125 [Taibaiella sp.]|nr:hypothetical protein [Taibaiella sp.]